MIANLHPYPDYKESGVSWIGRIPSRWQVRRMKLLLREIDSRSSTGKEQLLRVSQYTGVTQRKSIDGSDSPDTRASSLVGYKRVTPHDLVINIMLAWNGSMGVSRFEGIASPAYCVYRFKDGARPWYYHELLRLPLYKGRIKTASTGVVDSRLRLYSDDLGRIEAIQPPSDDQDAIVRFIDYANGRLERAIRAKRQVIALLHEQKQAIIHRAVTGQDHVVEQKRSDGTSTFSLQPSALPKKPSGIPWLGDIPKHWEVLPLKAVSEIQGGITLGKDYAGQPTRAYPYLRVANVQAGHASLAVVKTIRVTKAEAERCLLQKGDVLMTEGGDPDKLGRGCVWDAQVAPCLDQNHVFAVRPNQVRLEPQFLSALMGTRYARAYFQSTAKQTTNLAATNKTKIGMFKVLLPKVDEQNSILKALDAETSPVNTAIARLEREIELLREYRTRLVADVVTGKLDVRALSACLAQAGAARQLPVEEEASAGELSEEADPFDSSDSSDEVPQE